MTQRVDESLILAYIFLLFFLDAVLSFRRVMGRGAVEDRCGLTPQKSNEM